MPEKRNSVAINSRMRYFSSYTDQTTVKLQGFDDTGCLFVESKSELNRSPSRSITSLVSGVFFFCLGDTS